MTRSASPELGFLITFPKYTPQNTELYGVQSIFYCLQMYDMVYNHPFVEILQNYADF